MTAELDARQKLARKLLIETAKRNLNTLRPGLISYKELWNRVADEPWVRARAKTVVSIITKISAYEMKRGRPPLNELVVAIGKKQPTEPWHKIKKFLETKLGSPAVRYSNHLAAQQACWEYWGNKTDDVQSENEVEEGLIQDHQVRFRKRNARIIGARKLKDNFRCQACGFRKKVNGIYIIDCHHKFPLSFGSNVRITRMEELVCLCPTCHRIAHTMRFPLSPERIRNIVKKNR